MNGSRLLTVFVLAVTIGALYFAKQILLPIALAVLASFVLTRLVARLERWGLGRVAAVVIVAVGLSPQPAPDMGGDWPAGAAQRQIALVP